MVLNGGRREQGRPTWCVRCVRSSPAGKLGARSCTMVVDGRSRSRRKKGGEMVMNPRTGVRKVWVGEFGWELWLKSERGVAWATD